MWLLGFLENCRFTGGKGEGLGQLAIVLAFLQRGSSPPYVSKIFPAFHPASKTSPVLTASASAPPHPHKKKRPYTLEQNRAHKINLHIYGQHILNNGARNHNKSLVSSVGSVEASGRPQATEWNYTPLTQPTCKKQLKMDYRLSARISLSPVRPWREASSGLHQHLIHRVRLHTICKPSTGEEEAGRFKGQSHPHLHSKFKASLDYLKPYISRVWRDDPEVKKVFTPMHRILFGSQNPGWAVNSGSREAHAFKPNIWETDTC